MNIYAVVFGTIIKNKPLIQSTCDEWKYLSDQSLKCIEKKICVTTVSQDLNIERHSK